VFRSAPWESGCALALPKVVTHKIAMNNAAAVADDLAMGVSYRVPTPLRVAIRWNIHNNCRRRVAKNLAKLSDLLRTPEGGHACSPNSNPIAR